MFKTNRFAILILAMSFFFPKQAFAENYHPKVVVIGAGLAGLTAAYRLHQQGIDVHLYEARARVGGRILTAAICGHLVELGGQNIADGGEAGNIRHLVKDLGLELESSQISLTQAYFDGQNLIPFEEMIKNQPFDPVQLKNRLLELYSYSKNMQEVLEGLLDREDPLYKILSVRLAAYEGAHPEKLAPCYIKTLYYIWLGGLSSVHKKYEEEKYIDFVTIKGGNAQLPQQLALNLGNRLHLNEPLLALSKSEEGDLILSFPDRKIKADILLLANPCSTFQDITFAEDLLPPARLEALRNIQYGTNSKILIPYTAMSPPGIAIMNDRVIGFLGASKEILTLYYTGESSKFSQQTMTSTLMQDGPLIHMGFKDLDLVFDDPAVAIDQLYISYNGPVGYSWPLDPFVKGSYSYIAPGQERLLASTVEFDGEVVKTLFTPIDHKIYFAGEHASASLEIPGTMEAACESGEKAARMILNNISLTKSSIYPQ